MPKAKTFENALDLENTVIEAAVHPPETSQRSALRDQITAQAARFAKIAREATGLSRRQFARRVGIGASTLARVEMATKGAPPSLETLTRIARAAGKTLTLGLGD